MNPTTHLQAVQRAEIECLTGMLEATFDGFERLSRLQLQQLRDAAQGTSQLLRGALDARDAQEWAGLPQQLMQGDGARAAEYVQKFGEIAGAMQAGISEALQQGVAQLQQSLREAAEQAPSAAADGSANPNWMQGAIEMATQAMQGWSRSQAQAAQQLGEQMQQQMQQQMQRLARQGGGAKAATPPAAAPAARGATRRRAS